MTDDWLNKLYEKAGRDLLEAQVTRLLDEFKYLGSKNDSHNQCIQLAEDGGTNTIASGVPAVGVIIND